LTFPPARIEALGGIIDLRRNRTFRSRPESTKVSTTDREPAATYEAEYWIGVYSLLVANHEEALGRTEELTLTGDDEIAFLRSGLDTLRERLAYWRFRRGRDWLSSQPD
jgi:hypothetical protein